MLEYGKGDDDGLAYDEVGRRVERVYEDEGYEEGKGLRVVSEPRLPDANE